MVSALTATPQRLPDADQVGQSRRLTVERVATTTASAPVIEKRVSLTPQDANPAVRGKLRGLTGAPVAPDASALKVVARAPMPDPTLKFWGLVGYSDHNEAGTMNAHRGFYDIDGVGNFTKLDAFPISSSPSAPCAYTDDGRVIMQGVGDAYRVFSTSTWQESSGIDYPSREYYLFSTTWDPFTKSLLACVTNLSENKDAYPYQLAWIDPATMRRTVLANLAVPLYSIAVDPEGKIYALDQDFNFKSIDRSGEVTEIKAKTVPFVLDKAFGGGSMTWDPFGQRLLTAIRGVTDEPMASADPFPGCLYAIDPATGDATMIVQFTYNDEICGMTFPGGIYTAAAPAKVSGLTTTFTAGSMKGTIGFTAPTASVTGDALTGELTYVVRSDGKEVTTGTAQPGAAVTLEITAPESGEHTLSVQMKNGAGFGPVDGNTIFVGTDVPNAPVSVTASYSGSGLMLLSWTKVEDAVNGGYVDPEEVVYNVVRYNLTDTDEEPVAWTETKLTSWGQPMAEPETLTDYQFGVTATYDGKTSAETRSNIVRAGSLTTPFSYDFPDKENFEAVFTPINNNGDPYYNWGWSYEGWGDNKNGYVSCRRGYSEKGDVDKWIVTPGFRFESDKVYRVDIDVKASGNYYNECIEVMVGTNPAKPETWSVYAIEPTDFTGNTWRTLTGYISVPSNNKYYIGIHACTPSSRSTSTIYVDNLSVGQGVSSTAPGPVSDMSVTAGPLGTNWCDVKFTAPTKNFMQTQDLTALTAVKVYRNGEVVKTFTSPAPGSTLSFRDDDLKAGQYDYSVITENDMGSGPAVEAGTYVGVKLPARPNNVAFEESADTPGEVTITWDAVTADVDGGALPAQFVKYSVVELQGNNQIFLTDVEGTSYTYQAVEAGAKQQFKRYAVFAETESGTGYGLATTLKPVGKACTLPFVESFADARISNPVAISSSAWGTLMDGDIENGPVAADGDNGYACMIASYQNENSDLITGKISLEGATNPYLTFWTYNIVPNSGDADLNEYRIVVECDGVEEAAKSFAIAQECRLEGWNRVLVDLKKYAGKTIQVRFRATAVNFSFTLLDDVRIYDAPQHDLVIKEFATPEKTKTEKDFRVRVVIENYGSESENDYTINIYRDGNKVLTAPGKTVSPTQTVFADFTEAIPVTEPAGEHKYHAEVELAGDANPADNVSYETTVSLKHPKYPTVTELEGVMQGNEVALTWTKPEIKREPDMVTEDFEGYDCLTQDLDEWSLIDNDELPLYGFENFTFPGLLRGAPQSWFLIDNSNPGMQGIDTFGARSGDKCVMQFLPEDGACDDWLISPALFGRSQEIDFYARTYFQGDRCEFEFLYTTQEPSDIWGFSVYQFTPVASVNVYSHEWGHYTFEVPDGAKYFAIRAYTNAGVILMVDDVTFRPLASSALKLSGYNIYHNGTLLNGSPVSATAFTHKDIDPDATHEYAVTAVYTQGESTPVTASLAMSGIATIGGDGPEVAVEGRDIVVKRAAGQVVTVTTPSGLTLYSGIGAERTVIPVGASGIYLVGTAQRTFKVIVR